MACLLHIRNSWASFQCEYKSLLLAFPRFLYFDVVKTGILIPHLKWFYRYMLLFVLFRLHHQNTCFQMVWKTTWCLMCFGLSSLVCYGRIYLHYHTWPQVYWGILIGSILAIFWFLVVQFVMTPCFSWVTSTRIAEFFMLRDYTCIPNVMWFDYTNARGEANNRIRKMSRAKQQW